MSLDESGTSQQGFWPAVVLPTPAHRALAETLSYHSPQALEPGTLVRVPLGSRDVPGVGRLEFRYMRDPEGNKLAVFYSG